MMKSITADKRQYQMYCPSCDSYEVLEMKGAKTGKQHCTHCGHEWYEAPEEKTLDNRSALMIVSKAPIGMTVCFGRTQAHYVKGLQTLCGIFVALPNLSLYPVEQNKYIVCPACKTIAEIIVNGKPVHSR
jgi:Zn ribbon nucleic-acid-binding protein